MTLQAGATLGPSEVVAAIGAGGMEVSRARDTRRKRDVALKVLPDASLVTNPAAAAVLAPDGQVLAFVARQSATHGERDSTACRFLAPEWPVPRVHGNDRANKQRPEIMVASYAVNGDSFRANKPMVVAETRTMTRPGSRSYSLDPDGERVAIAPVPEGTAAKQDKVVVIFNFFDELRRITPVSK